MSLLTALNALTEHHLARCTAYAHSMRTLFPIHIETPPQSLADVPYLPVRAFKEFALKSIPDEDVYKVMRSSGTSGAVSQIFLDKGTARAQTNALVAGFADAFGKGRFPMLIIDAASTVEDRTRFSARTAAINGFSMFSRGRCFALDDDMSLNLPRVRAFLEKHAGQKVFVFGFTFLVFQGLVQQLQAQGETLELADAFLLHGGGWKKLEAQKVDDAAFKAALKAHAGLPSVHNYYGMVEQTGTIFVECEAGRLHASDQGDAMIRDPKDFVPLPHGQTGLIQVFSTIQESYPGHALLTEDVGRTFAGESCSCGRTGTILEIDGRLERAEVRGCSDAYT